MIDDANRDPELRNTPLGDLSLRQMGSVVGVWVDDGLGFPRCLFILREGKCVWDALNGKAFWEGEAVQALYARRDEVRDGSHAREEAAMGRDLALGVERLLNRRDDAREAIAMVVAR